MPAGADTISPFRVVTGDHRRHGPDYSCNVPTTPLQAARSRYVADTAALGYYYDLLQENMLLFPSTSFASIAGSW